MALVGHSAGGHLALLGSKLGKADDELVMRILTHSLWSFRENLLDMENGHV